MRPDHTYGTVSNALDELGLHFEALWARVKDTGYMSILHGKHEFGRKIINDVVTELLQTHETERTILHTELLFYCYRYLGISYQRDSVSGSMENARECFVKSQHHIAMLPQSNATYKEMHARILGNFGNIALDEQKPDDALALYKKSLTLFQELSDFEHAGIGHLNIGRALIAKGELDSAELTSHLIKAQSYFSHIGWIEGLGRVHEQYARRFLMLSERAVDQADRDKQLADATAAAGQAKVLFERMGSARFSGRIDRLLEQIADYKSHNMYIILLLPDYLAVSKSKPIACPVVSGAELFLAGTASCRSDGEGVDKLHLDIEPSGAPHPDEKPQGRTSAHRSSWCSSRTAISSHSSNAPGPITLSEPLHPPTQLFV